MTVLLDSILVLVLIVCAIIGWKRGFIRTIRGFISYIISFAIANSFYRAIAKFVIKIPLLQGMIHDVEMPETPINATFIDKMGLITKYIKENMTLSNTDEMASDVKAIIGNYVVELLASIIAFLLLFFGVYLILKLFLFLLDKFVSNTPFIRHANGALGGVAGLLSGFFWTWMIANVFMKFAFPFFAEKWPNILWDEVGSSTVLNFLTKINPITYLFSLINMLSNR